MPNKTISVIRISDWAFVWDLLFGIWNLMVIIFVSGASLSPLSSVSFPADFLPDRGIGHVDQAEKKTSQMSQVSNASSGSCPGRIKFNEAKDDHEIFGRNGKKEIDVDGSVRKKPTEGEQNSIDCSRGSDDQHILIAEKKNGEYGSTDPTEEEIK